MRSFLQSDFDIGVVYASTGKFEHGNDVISFPRVYPKEIRSHFGRFLDGFGFGFWKRQKLPEQRSLFTNRVPHRVNAFDHACFT